MKMEEERIEEPILNLSQHIINEIAELLSEANKSFVRSDFNNAMQNLQAVRLRISQNLQKKELEELESIANQFMERLPKTKAVGFNTADPKAVAEVYGLYKEYNDLIMNHLKKQSLLIPTSKKQRKNT